MIKNSLLLVLAVAALAYCPLGHAQDQERTPNQQPSIDSTIAQVRANMLAGRTAIITAGMNFNDKDGAAFWPVYHEYE
jgi:hypothetical protein